MKMEKVFLLYRSVPTPIAMEARETEALGVYASREAVEEAKLHEKPEGYIFVKELPFFK